MRYTCTVDEPQQKLSFAFPKPGAVMISLIAGMFCLWAVMASLAKWGESTVLFDTLVGRPDRLFSEPWRIFTNPFVHDYRGLPHVLTRLVMLYFMATSLEQRWGKARFIGFLVAVASLSSFVELLVERLVPWFQVSGVVFGSTAMINAACVAWAANMKGAQVRLYGAVPMNATVLLVMLVVMNVLAVVWGAPAEGYLTPFVAMGLGFLLSDVSPLRRFYLQNKYKRLALKSARIRVQREGRAELRVIQGGASKKPDRSMLN